MIVRKIIGNTPFKFELSKLILLSTIVIHLQIIAQNNLKSFSNEEKLFLGYFNQIRLTKKLGVWCDLHHRTVSDFVKEPYQSIARVAMSYYFNHHLKLMAGYAFAYNYNNSHNRIVRFEDRPWQQVFFKSGYGYLQCIQMLRLEQRIIEESSGKASTDSFNYLNRIRYNYLLQFPFSKKKDGNHKLQGVLSNEIFINIGKNLGANVFDQNRFFAGLGYQFSKSTVLHLGYMNIVQKLQNGFDFINSHCVRIFLFQTFYLRKEK